MPTSAEEWLALVKQHEPAAAIFDMTFADLRFNTDWVYRFKLPKRTTSVGLLRGWNRFSRNVEKMAA